jgi:segregation and condensation protein A
LQLLPERLTLIWMSESNKNMADWPHPSYQVAENAPALVIDVDGFEGPLDVLLELARRQKVDLQRISILALAEQYLIFIDKARAMRLELAADYLVMAAWLAYLKSRLLLPDDPLEDEEPSAADLAAALALRLRRLEAVRAAAQRLNERPLLGRERFARGMPEYFEKKGQILFDASLYELLSAYAQHHYTQQQAHITFKPRAVWSLEDAREALRGLMGGARHWAVLDDYLRLYAAKPMLQPTIRASTLSVVLEMVKAGQLTLRQDAPFAPLWVKQHEGEMQ